MNSSVSGVSILILFALLFFFIYEVSIAIRIRNKKIKGKIGVHVLGTITTLLVTVSVALSTFGINYDSNLFIIVTVVLAVLFYIILGWTTLFKIKK